MKITFILPLLLFTFNSFAKESLTCLEIYQKIAVEKQIKKKHASDTAYQLGSGALITAFLNPFVSLGFMAGSAGLSIYAGRDPRESKALDMRDDEGHVIHRLARKYQREISCDITAFEIMSIVNEGFESGQFCENFPKLYSDKDVRRFLARTLRERHQP
jgi:hypothetical protein